MNFLRIYSCTVQRYCSYNSINGVIKRCSHTFDKQEHDGPQKITKSAIYPDYQIIYKFPYIKNALIVSKIKRNFTVVIGVTIPAMGILTMTDLIETDFDMIDAVCSFALAAVIHRLCRVCNNLVGAIYYKKDEDKIIISYLSYWGKRVDLLTDVNDVSLQRTTSNRIAFPHSYRKLYVKSQEKNLKIFITSENIVDESIFYKTFGRLM